MMPDCLEYGWINTGSEIGNWKFEAIEVIEVIDSAFPREYVALVIEKIGGLRLLATW